MSKAEGRSIYYFGTIILFLLYLTGDIEAHREHKVHNIVLYPDKHSWCKTLPIKQVISYPDCKFEEIDNNVCVGACFSYSIPHTEPSDPGEVIVPYCDSCQPSDTTWHHVTLECTKNNPDTPPQLVKRVQIINNCSCTSCEKNHFNPPSEFENDFDSLMVPNNDVPDLLNFVNTRNETPYSVVDSEHAKKMRSIMNHKIVTLLKNIQEHNSQYDKQQLMNLLRVVQGPNQKISDKSIADFVDSLNTENIELDIPRLREILIKFEHSKHYEKHKKYLDHLERSTEVDDGFHQGVDSDDDDSDSSNDDGDSGIERIHHGLGHLKGSHIGMGLHSTSLLDQSNQNGDTISEGHDQQLIDSVGSDSGSGGDSSSNNHHKYHHHHHIGEKIVGQGHLARGPHGALIIEPDHRIHEKLDVNPHELKPNHAGTLLSYSSHSTDKSKSLD